MGAFFSTLEIMATIELIELILKLIAYLYFALIVAGVCGFNDRGDK